MKLVATITPATKKLYKEEKIILHRYKFSDYTSKHLIVLAIRIDVKTTILYQNKRRKEQLIVSLTFGHYR